MFLSYLSDLYAQLSPKMFWHIQGNGEMGKLKDNDMSSGEFVAVLRQSKDYVMLVYRLTRRMMDPEFSPNHAMQVYVRLNFMIDGWRWRTTSFVLGSSLGLLMVASISCSLDADKFSYVCYT